MSVQINNIIKRVGKELDVLVFDFGAKIDSSAIARDGVHLTPEGQKSHVSSTIRAFYNVLPLLERCN
ncbi:MAG: SGNH/GDSL hydrolase family protein [Oligoflexales bacterium]|nr:SGNH/GDSL hydrolase family protein [Oligoflexales bacterium]